MDDQEKILLGICIVLLFVVFLSKKKKVTTKSNLVQDGDVTTDGVYQKLKKCKVDIVDGRKNGFTEKGVHKQLEKQLKDIYQNVTLEQGVESKNAKAIDFDIGNGKVGIEIKIAGEIFKEGNWDRALGQMIKYTRNKYKSGNFIVVVVGFEEDFRNSILSEFEDDVHKNKGEFWFINAGSKEQVLK